MLSRVIARNAAVRMHSNHFAVPGVRFGPQVRGFSSGPDGDQDAADKKDWQSYVTENAFKTFEQVNDLVFPADQQKELTDQEVIQEIVRANHLAKVTMNSVSKGLKKAKSKGDEDEAKSAAQQEEEDLWGGSDFYSEYNELHSS